MSAETVKFDIFVATVSQRLPAWLDRLHRCQQRGKFFSQLCCQFCVIFVGYSFAFIAIFTYAINSVSFSLQLLRDAVSWLLAFNSGQLNDWSCY